MPRWPGAGRLSGARFSAVICNDVHGSLKGRWIRRKQVPYRDPTAFSAWMAAWPVCPGLWLRG